MHLHVRRAVAAFVAASVVSAVSLVACSEESPRTEEPALGTATEALTACTPQTNCGTGMGCCGGFCRPVVSLTTASPRLAAMSGTTLTYACYANASAARVANPVANNMIPNYAYAGYKGGGVTIPTVPACNSTPIAATGNPVTDTDNIHKAIHRQVAPFSGCTPPFAVVLAAGVFHINATVPTGSKVGLQLDVGGVVLRGQGQGGGSPTTTLYSRISGPHTFIKMGNGDKPPEGTKIAIDNNVSVGSYFVPVESPNAFAVGNRVAIVRNPNTNWTQDIGESPDWEHVPDAGLLPEPLPAFDVAQYRKVVGTNVDGIFVDIPMVDAIYMAHGSGYVTVVAANDTADYATYTRDVGLENLLIDSEFTDQTLDSDVWDAIRMDRVRDSWVRKVTVKKYGRSAVHIADYSDFNTVEEVAYIEPVSPLNPPGTSYPGLPKSSHRYPFWITEGMGNLFQRCYTHDARHSFVTGGYVSGPNVWLDSLAESSLSEEGPHLRWGTGLLFDNVRAEPAARAVKVKKCIADPPNGWPSNVVRCSGSFNGTCCPHVPVGADANDPEYHAGGLRVRKSEPDHGWTGAQNMFWNSETDLMSEAPPAAMNYVIGGVARQHAGDNPFGIWQLQDTRVTPRSLYLQQLKERAGVSMSATTPPAQRTGRVWDALRSWGAALRGVTPAGAINSGRLDDHYPIPSCVEQNGYVPGNTPRSFTPIPSGTKRACCPPGCNGCGGGNCSQLPLGSTNCCVGSIVDANPPRSCLHFPPPCAMPNPDCTEPVAGEDHVTTDSTQTVCCSKDQCSVCGGSACDDSPNDANECCVPNIVASARSCKEFPPPCVMGDPECVAGVPGSTTCCDPSCGQCGGANCSAGSSAANCCTSTIQAAGESCSTNYAPCVLD
jgi:hypothetical protein